MALEEPQNIIHAAMISVRNRARQYILNIDRAYSGRPPMSNLFETFIDNIPEDGIFRIPDTVAYNRGATGFRCIDVTMLARLMDDGSVRQSFVFPGRPGDVEVTTGEVAACESIHEVHELFLSRFYEPAVPASLTAPSPKVSKEDIIEKRKKKLGETRNIDL